MPAAAQIAAWIFRPIEFLDACRKRYGDSFQVTFPGFETPMVLISHPDHVRELFSEPTHGLPPGRSLALEPILGPRSVLLLEGSDHLARRKLMLPPFHGSRMRAYEGVIDEVVNREVDSWATDREFPIHPRMQAITLEVILRAVFGVSDERRMRRLRPLLGSLLDATSGRGLQVRFIASQRLSFVKDPLAALRRRQHETDELLALEVAERRADPDLAEREDILSMLVAARFEDGEAMSGAELRDQLMTLLVAGHETTATALAWAFDLLLRHPRQLERVRAEISEGENDAYLRAVVAEALRLRPVVPLAGRRLTKPMALAGHELPAGTDVTPAIWLTNTHSATYERPEAFEPERFLDGGPETYSWIPFGGGVRRCLGAAFAEFEMREVLRIVLDRCELKAVRTKPEGITRRNITLSPKNGTPVKVRRRSSTRPAPTAAPA